MGATSDGQSEINIGTAAHICAAAPGGPRFDPHMSKEDRRSANNGIWMCRDHGKAIDSPDPSFTVAKLREWKKVAEQESWHRVTQTPQDEVVCVASSPSVHGQLRQAADTDLEVYRRTDKWPSSSVALTLQVEGIDEPATTDVLAKAVLSLDDLVLVAAPGMGKTTTLFQIADNLASGDIGIPILVPLADWATEGRPILASVLARPAFQSISEQDFRDAAAVAGIVLLFDGWNELSNEARNRARVQVSKLKAELPEIGIIIATRQQFLNVPLVGRRVDLLPLNEDQQLGIAKIIKGEAGEALLDQAWRTSGVRELVTIPLYLMALLSLPSGSVFPTTKEELLRHFVAAHEIDAAHANALQAQLANCQATYLTALAVLTTQLSSSALREEDARRAASSVANQLLADGQLATKPEPSAILDTLINDHVLMRASVGSGVSFQHQQFQEWYASHDVEKRILADIGTPTDREKVKGEIFDRPEWEESILFAVERLSRAGQAEIVTCGNAILTAFAVDPMLAAEMIFRTTDAVWSLIASPIEDKVVRWHAPGKSDRAMRFMLTSGRPEFLPYVWPLITDENQQVSLAAIRNCKGFRPSILSKDAAAKIKALPSNIRGTLLYEIAMSGGIEGLDLVAGILSTDSDPNVKAMVVDALAFRRADRHVGLVLKNASAGTFDILAERGHLDEVDDKNVQASLAAAQVRVGKKAKTAVEKLQRIVRTDANKIDGEALTALVGEIDLDAVQGRGIQLLEEAAELDLQAAAAGLLAKLRAGKPLYYRASELLARAGFSLEDDDLFQAALIDGRNNEEANAAASVLGPISTGRLIDASQELKQHWKDDQGRYDKVVADRYHEIKHRLAHSPPASLIAAIRAREAAASASDLAEFCDLLSSNATPDSDRQLPLSEKNAQAIRDLIATWAPRMLAPGDVNRSHTASIARLISHVPAVSLLPILQNLLDDNLARYRCFREQAKADGFQTSPARDEAMHPHTSYYQQAFRAIPGSETAALMGSYLADEHFGELAAQILAGQWSAANEPVQNHRFFGGVDYSLVAGRQAELAINPDGTSVEADTMFAEIGTIDLDTADEERRSHAIKLAIVAARLPHGQRGELIDRLISLAPRRLRAALLLALVLSGHRLNSALVSAGLAETLEQAKTQRWILMDNGVYQLREWLRLLPFLTEPLDALPIIRILPETHTQWDILKEVVMALPYSGAAMSEELLFKLAEEYPRLYKDHDWRDAALKFDTASALRRLVNLMAAGTLSHKSHDNWYWARALGSAMDRFPCVRTHIYEILRADPELVHVQTLLAAVAENPDDEGLLLLTELELTRQRSLLGWRTIEHVVTARVPVEGWNNAYNVVPTPAGDLRKKLFAMVTDGCPTDIAASHLTAIDMIRDQHGLADNEPRHPDLASGKNWPILRPSSLES